MTFWRRGPRAPEEALARLDPEERVLSWAISPDGAVVATPAGLWLPAGERISWHLLTHVVWNGAVLTLTVARPVEDDVLELDPPVKVRLTEPQTLPETVQQRFYSSRAHTARHRLGDGTGVIVVARRVPGVDGLSWYVVFDEPSARHDPVVRAEAAQRLAEERAPA